MARKYVMIPGKVFDDEYFGVRKYYIEMFNELAPVLVLPPMQVDEYESLMDGCKLLVLPGGSDVLQASRGNIPSMWAGQPDPYLEYYDKTLFPLAIDCEVPVLGICRGFQSILSYYGVKLIQNLPNHPYSETWVDRIHTVTRLYADGSWKVSRINSLHHQGQLSVNIPPTFEVLATSPADGICEAFVHTEDKVMGIQWHPEVLEYDDWVFDWVQKLVSK